MTHPSKDKSPKKGTPSPQADGEVDFSKDPLKDKIGSSLRQMYDDVVNEPVPDDFLNLLQKADTSSK